MKEEAYAKVKVTASLSVLEEIAEVLERRFIVARTSKVIAHREDENCHVYLAVLGRRTF